MIAHILTAKSVSTYNIPVEEPLENRQKESSEELSQVKTAVGQNRIHLITVPPEDDSVIPLHKSRC